MECQKCKKVLSRKGSHFLCQGQCQGTFHRGCVKGLAADIKAGKNRIYCNNCEEDESEFEDQDDESQDTEKILKEIQKNVRAIPGLKKQLDSIKHSMSLLSDKYDSLLEEHEKSKVKISKLEKTVEAINNKCTHMEKCNSALEQRLHEYEQSTRKHNVEIVGVEQMPNEDVKLIIENIAKEIDVSTKDVEWVRRSQPRKQQSKSPSIIVGFKTSGTETRDMWLSNRRKLADITSDKITDGTSKNKLFINEDLTKTTKELLWNTKKQLKSIYKYIWVINGKILVKKNDGDKSIWIRSDSDINGLLKSKDN